MGSLERFKIDLRGLKSEVDAFEFSLGNDFFEDLDTTDVRGGALTASVEVRKTGGAYRLQIHVEGDATVGCDICLDDMSLPVATDYSLVVKLGDNYLEDGDFITIPAEEGTIDLAWPIYESIALAISTRHVHEPGGCNTEMADRVRQLSVKPGGETIDPRWSELEKLKSTINE